MVNPSKYVRAHMLARSPEHYQAKLGAVKNPSPEGEKIKPLLTKNRSPNCPPRGWFLSFCATFVLKSIHVIFEWSWLAGKVKTMTDTQSL